MILNIKFGRHLLAVLVGAYPLLGAAQDVQEADLADPRWQMNLRSVGHYTDNFYYAPDDGVSALGAVFTPQAKFHSRSTKVDLQAELEGEYGQFDLPGSEDDYFDAALRASMMFHAGRRNNFRLSGGFRSGHDPFGIDRTEDLTVRGDELDKWTQTEAGLSYRYGAPGARVNAEIGARMLDRRYTSNRDETRPLDYSAVTGSYTLYYHESPKTAALLDVSRTRYDFDQPFGSSDTRAGDLYRVRTGVRWLATAKTAGDVRVGYRRRTFEAATNPIEGFDWEAAVEWAPVPRSVLKLTTARSEQQSYQTDTRVIDLSASGLEWTHSLSSRARSILAVQHFGLDFEGSARTDDIVGGSATLEYLALSHLWLVANVGTRQRDSSFDTRDYDRLSAYLGVRVGR